MRHEIGDGRDREVLEGEIVDGPEFGAGFLPHGTTVHVYRTSDSSPHWFYDPVTGTCTTEFSLDPYVVGTIREGNDDRDPQYAIYRVTVVRNGRELYLDWMARYWVRLPHEPPPTYHFDSPLPRR